MLVLPTDWSPRKTSLYFANADTPPAPDMFLCYQIVVSAMVFSFFPYEKRELQRVSFGRVKDKIENFNNYIGSLSNTNHILGYKLQNTCTIYSLSFRAGDV